MKPKRLLQHTFRRYCQNYGNMLIFQQMAKKAVFETLTNRKKTIMSKISNYIKESRIELKKVVWPTRKQATNHTLMVIGISLGVALFLGAIDYLLTLLLQVFIQ
jgi:preprotein translocase subunit SecE